MKHAKVAKLSLSTVVIVLLLLTSASFYFVSGTLAKYVSSASVTETARVAKWGISIAGTTSSGLKMFPEEYYEGDDYNTGSGASLIARSTTASSIIAPGTGNSYIVKVTGSAEVSSKLIFDASQTEHIGDWTDNDNQEYYPIVWTVTRRSNGAYDDELLLEKGSLQEFKDTMASVCVPFAPNQEINEEYTITWNWIATDVNAINVRDTALALKEEGNNPPLMKFVLATTVRQTSSKYN